MAAERRPASEERRTRCPLCGRPAAAALRPFCSRTCRDRDLLNWLDGRYAVPAAEAEEDEAGPPEDQDG